jgi:hypothetical protein
MAFLSLHTVHGDPDDLMARTLLRLDPVLRRHAPGHGGILRITARTGQGILTVNLWESVAGATAFGCQPDVVRARRECGLVGPACVQDYADADCTLYL